MIEISVHVHHRIDDDESWQVSDTGGDYDDEEHEEQNEADADAEDRARHYRAAGHVVSVVRS